MRQTSPLAWFATVASALLLQSLFASDAPCTLRTVVGDPTPYAGDGGPATEASLYFPAGLTLAEDGSIYVADRYNYRIRRIGPDATISTVAGDGVAGFSGDGGPALSARVNRPIHMAAGSDGSIYFSDQNRSRVRRIRPDGYIEAVAGNGQSEFDGESGPALEMSLGTLYGMAVDAQNNLYLSGWPHHRIRKVTPGGQMTTIAGSGETGSSAGGFAGDGGPATEALLKNPHFVAVAPDGSVFISDVGNHRIRRIRPDGVIETVAGNGENVSAGDGGPAVDASFHSLGNLAFGANGALYVRDDDRIRVIANGIISEYAPEFSTDFFVPDRNGGLYFSEFAGSIRHIGPGGAVDTLVGTDPGDLATGAPSDRVLLDPDDMDFDGEGNLYFIASDKVYRLSPDGMIFWHAGTGESGLTEEGTLAREVKFQNLDAIAVTPDGTVYVADDLQNRVFRVASDGRVYAHAGNGTRYDEDSSFKGLNGPALSAPIAAPTELAVDGNGNLYIAEKSGLYRIVKVDTEGIVTLVTYSRSSPHPRSLAVDSSNTLYVGYGGSRGIVKYSSNESAETLTGTANVFGVIMGMAFDPQGNLYITDPPTANPLWKHSPDGTLAALHEYQWEGGSYGEGGPVLGTDQLGRNDVAVDQAGNLLVSGQYRIRSIAAPAACNGVVRPIVNTGAIVHAASFVLYSGKVAPGEIVTAFGVNLGPPQLAPAALDSNNRLATELGGMQFKFDGIPAPIVYAWAFQTSFVVPYEVRDSTRMTVEMNGAAMDGSIVFDVVEAQPGLFTSNSSGQGQGAILNQDTTLNSPQNPAERGSIVVLYGTGEGRTSPEVPTGTITGSVLPHPVLPVQVFFGSAAGEVLYFGGAPGAVAGVFQANVRIPADAPLGDEVPVSIRVGEASTESQSVTVAIR